MRKRTAPKPAPICPLCKAEKLPGTEGLCCLRCKRFDPTIYPDLAAIQEEMHANPTRALSFTLPADVADFFEEMHERLGNNPQEVLATMARDAIYERLHRLEQNQDDRGQELSNAVTTWLSSIPRQDLRNILKPRHNCWPYTEVDRPASLDDAYAAAAERGKLAAAKRAEDDRLIDLMLNGTKREKAAATAEYNALKASRKAVAV